ncbi:SRPBCC family protein [Rhodococcus olei]|uniref:SRPBCC family protein n=1 Tax=Rhodococcus olei TaxID=2161675 RepID=A0ABP8P6P0_9NOCA
MAAVDVRTEAVIARPRSVVADFACDPVNATAWYANITEARWTSNPPLVVGSTFEFVAEFLGRRLAYTYEVREYTPGERLVMSTARGPFPMRTEYEWRDAGRGSTLMTLRNVGEPSGFGAVAAPLMAAAMRRANRKDLDRLKELLEAE